MTIQQTHIDSLLAIGLSQHEAEVYLSMLRLGPTSVLKIAKASGVKRTTIYSVIDSLQRRGLLRIDQKGFKKYFVAEGPHKLESLLEEKRHNLRNMLPELHAIYNLGESDSLIKYYEGIEAVKSVYQGLLEGVKPGDDYLIISNPDSWHKLAPEFFSDFLSRRSKLPIKVRSLFQDVAWGRQRAQLRLDPNMQIKFLPKGTNLSTNLVVIPQRVVVHQLVPPVMAMVIENKSIIQMHRESFEIMWRAL